MNAPAKIIRFLIILSFGLNLSYSTPIFPLNCSQTLSLSTESAYIFKIQQSTDSILGTFNITINLKNNSASATITRQDCNQAEQRELLPYNRLGLHGISFVADAFDNNCFQIKFTNNSKHITLNYSIDVTFFPVESLLQPRVPVFTEFLENEEKGFSYKSKNQSVEMVLITAKSKNNIKGPLLKLRQPQNNCLEIGPEASWLCYFSDKSDILTVFLYNPSETQSYKISIFELTSEHLYPDSQAYLNHLIPSFGTFIKVNAPIVGIIKAEALAPKDHPLPIIVASTLEELFKKLVQAGPGLADLDAGYNISEHLIIQNKQPNTTWYYFIQQNHASEAFRITSNFIEQATLEVDNQVVFEINPTVYEYKHIQVKLGEQGPGEYEVYAYSDNRENMIIIYFDSNSDPIEDALFPDQNTHKRMTSGVKKNTGFTLSFPAGKDDNSVYLSVQAFRKGLYVLNVRKVGPITLWTALIIVGLTSFIIMYSFFCVAKLCKIPKFDEIDDSQEPPEIPGEDRQLADLEASSEIQLKAEAKMRSMIAILKKLQKLEGLEKSKGQDHEEKNKDKAQEHEVIEIKEEENCDICYEAKKTVTFEPCGHRCSCTFCSLMIIKGSMKCPLCRGEIAEVSITKENQQNLK